MSTKYFKWLFYRQYEKNELNEYVFYFSVDYDFIDVDDILDIKKTWYGINKMFGFIKKIFFTAIILLVAMH